MSPTDPAPTGLRRLATASLFAAAIVALAYLPTDELPLPWLIAFTAPGAVLGAWSRLALSPWRRALLAVVLQAGACYTALEIVGPMTRPAALACTILPPLAFTTTRNHDHDPSLALFLSFCVLLVGVILDGWHLPLLLAYGTTAFLSLHVSTLLGGFRRSRRMLREKRLHADDVTATSSMLLGCLLALFAIERTLQWLPSPSQQARGGGGTDASAEGVGGGDDGRSVGLDDSFVLDGSTGMLSDLAGEQLVRVEAPDGEGVPTETYLRCGFFTLPRGDRWEIGPRRLRPQSRPDGHVFGRPSARPARLREFAIERYGGAAKFVFTPQHVLRLQGLSGVMVDQERGWIRPRTPDDTIYFATFETLPGPEPGIDVADVTRMPELLELPAGDFGRARYERLLDAWDVGGEPVAAMARITAGLDGHCRYNRRTPTGPFDREIDNFLFADGDRYGYCMHFAWAAAVMLRLRGIPCRIGVGLYGGTPDRLPGARTFGSHHAHAWVEIPLEGRGFEIFDPTPSSMRGRGFVSSNTPGGPSDPDLDVQRGGLAPTIRAIGDVLTLPLTWAIVLAAALIAAILPRREPRPPARTTRPPSPEARRLLARMLKALARAGHVRAPNQTLELFQAQLRRAMPPQPEVDDAVAAYQQIRFGGQPLDDERLGRLQRGAEAARQLAAAARRNAGQT